MLFKDIIKVLTMYISRNISKIPNVKLIKNLFESPIIIIVKKLLVMEVEKYAIFPSIGFLIKNINGYNWKKDKERPNSVFHIFLKENMLKTKYWVIVNSRYWGYWKI